MVKQPFWRPHKPLNWLGQVQSQLDNW